MRWLVRAVTLAALVLASSVASAQDGELTTAEAKARFKEGLALTRAGKTAEARIKYIQVLALEPQAHGVLLNLAIVENDLKRHADAFVHLRAFLNHPKADPQLQEKARREILPELFGKVGQARVLAKDGAEITVDGSPAGRAPLADALVLDPGTHKIAAGAQSADVTLAGGQSRDVDLRPSLAPTPAPTPAPTSTQAPAPSYTFTPPPPPPPEKGTTKWIVGGGLAAGAVAGIAVGAGFGLAAGKTADDVDGIQSRQPGGCRDRQSAVCQDVAAKISDLDRQRTLSFIGYGAGAVLGVGAVVAVLVWPSGRSSALGVQPATGGGVFSWHGRF